MIAKPKTVIGATTSLVAINEALLIASLRQHELTETAEKLAAKLQHEIAEHKKTEETLRQSEERLRIVFETGPIAVYTCDVTGVILDYNQRAIGLWGRTPEPGDRNERFCGSFKLYRADGSFMPHDENPLADVLQGKMAGVYDAEVLIERPDGSRIVVNVNIAPLKNAKGEITGAVNCFYDITERRDAAKALRESEERFRALVTNGSEVVYRMTSDWSEMLPLDGRDVFTSTEKPSRSWLVDYIPPEDQALVMQVVQEAIRTKGVFELEHRIIRRDGTRGWTSSRAIPRFNAKGEITEWFGAANDVTQRKEAEEKLRESQSRLTAVLEQLPVGVSLVDLDGQIILLNSVMRQFLPDLIPSNDLQRIHRWHALAPDGSQLEVRQWPGGRALRGETVVPGIEFHFTTDDGRQIWTLVAATPLRGISGKVIGAVVMVQDIDQRKQAEAALKKAQEQLEHYAVTLEATVEERTVDLKDVNDQLSAFVYSIAHDLRAPLRAMQGFSQTMIDDYAPSLDEAARNYLQRINASSEFMDKMIIDLLAFGRAGRLETEMDSVKVQDAWNSALFQYAGEIEETKTQIETVAPLPTVHANEAALAQVLANLLSNGMKFVGEGVRPKIRFWAEEGKPMDELVDKKIIGLLDEGMNEAKSTPPTIHSSIDPATHSIPAPGFVRLWVEDNGMGIPLKYQERIFRVFERLHGARYAGTGIGLSIVRKGIERMGGKVGLESKLGTGTRFWIDLQKA